VLLYSRARQTAYSHRVCARRTEVDQQRIVLRQEHHVPRLDVAVDHPVRMRVVEGARHFGGDPERLRGGSTKQACGSSRLTQTSVQPSSVPNFVSSCTSTKWLTKRSTKEKAGKAISQLDVDSAIGAVAKW
jgi:hypothetical protein